MSSESKNGESPETTSATQLASQEAELDSLIEAVMGETEAVQRSTCRQNSVRDGKEGEALSLSSESKGEAVDMEESLGQASASANEAVLRATGAAARLQLITSSSSQPSRSTLQSTPGHREPPETLNEEGVWADVIALEAKELTRKRLLALGIDPDDVDAQ